MLGAARTLKALAVRHSMAVVLVNHIVGGAQVRAVCSLDERCDQGGASSVHMRLVNASPSRVLPACCKAQLAFEQEPTPALGTH